MPMVRARLGQDGVVLGAVVLTVAIFVTVATVSVTWIVAVATLFLGVAWIAVLTTLNGTVQAILPNWVRGRALALYITVQSGAMALGSLVWGRACRSDRDDGSPARRGRMSGGDGAVVANVWRKASGRRG